jgi:hypothetical protein
MNHKLAILIVSCDKYSDLWPIFFGCFFKNWPDCPYNIYLVSNYKVFADRRVETLLVGEDIDYSSSLIKAVTMLDYEYIFPMVEDYFVSNKVSTANIEEYFGELVQSRASYLKMVRSYPLSYEENDSRIGYVSNNVKYRVSVSAAIWNREMLLKFLVPGESAWDIERHGAKRSDDLEINVMAIRFSSKFADPFDYVHGVVGGKWFWEAVPFLIREGFYKNLRSRSFQMMHRYLYVRLYWSVAWIVMKCRLTWRRR